MGNFRVLAHVLGGPGEANPAKRLLSEREHRTCARIGLGMVGTFDRTCAGTGHVPYQDFTCPVTALIRHVDYFQVARDRPS